MEGGPLFTYSVYVLHHVADFCMQSDENLRSAIPWRHLGSFSRRSLLLGQRRGVRSPVESETA